MRNIILVCLAFVLLPQSVLADATAYTRITSASATACSSIEINGAGSGRLVSITNTGAAQSVYLTIYDEGSSPTCAAGDLLYGDGSTITLGAGQVVTLNIPVTAGIAYKLSAASTGAILIARN